MNIYISGISGTGMGPLALMAKQAGLNVFGSDLAEGAISSELYAAEIPFQVGATAQDGTYLKSVADSAGVDWLVHTSALPADHPEIVAAKELGIRVSKRDELIAFLVDKLGLSLVAVAGTHGKTTTTAMIIWACSRLGIPISYLVGTTLPFAEAGRYNPESSFLVYEADEYDRNFLHFSPWLAVITAVSYDHPDIYPSVKDYQQAFLKFIGQSERVIFKPEAVEATVSEGKISEAFRAGSLRDSGCTTLLSSEILPSDTFTLPGQARRYDAALAAAAVSAMAEEAGIAIDTAELVSILDRFPGVGRRFEKIADGVYSDYGHHPEEISATLEIAREEAERLGLSGVVAIYEPHQNSRQHGVLDGYRRAFRGVSHLYWVPTFLTREDPSLPVISPEEFIAELDFSNTGDSSGAAVDGPIAEAAELDERLAAKLREWREKGHLILLMSAGPADGWLRKTFEP